MYCSTQFQIEYYNNYNNNNDNLYNSLNGTVNTEPSKIVYVAYIRTNIPTFFHKHTI